MTPRLSSLLKRLQPAGVILFARNIKSPEQTWRLLRDARSASLRRYSRALILRAALSIAFAMHSGAAPSAADVFDDR